jgi:hypothetical protein
VGCGAPPRTPRLHDRWCSQAPDPRRMGHWAGRWRQGQLRHHLHRRVHRCGSRGKCWT